VYESGLHVDLGLEDWGNASVGLNSISRYDSRLPVTERGLRLAIALDEVSDDHRGLFANRLSWYDYLTDTGRWQEADAVWQTLQATQADHNSFPDGYVELRHAFSLHRSGQPNWEYWSVVEELIQSSNSIRILRKFHCGQGLSRLEQDEWQPAITSLQQALRMARERSIPDTESETGLALAKFQLGQLDQPRDEAQRLAEARKPAHRNLARLWLAIGDPGQARRHALAAYQEAWADGEPYVYRYGLTKATEILTQLGVPIPRLPDYDPAADIPRPWEAEVAAAIDKLRKEKKGAA